MYGSELWLATGTNKFVRSKIILFSEFRKVFHAREHSFVSHRPPKSVVSLSIRSFLGKFIKSARIYARINHQPTAAALNFSQPAGISSISRFGHPSISIHIHGDSISKIAALPVPIQCIAYQQTQSHFISLHIGGAIFSGLLFRIQNRNLQDTHCLLRFPAELVPRLALANLCVGVADVPPISF